MSKHKTAAIVLAAGLGTRMKSAMPKVMHPVVGHPMVCHVMDTLARLAPSQTVVVTGPDMDNIAGAVAPHPTAIQHERLGTGHAVMAAMETLGKFKGNVLVVYGDTPLISEQTLGDMLEARNSAANPAVVVLGFVPDEPGDYGRLIVDEEDGQLEAIVEAKDATPEQLSVNLCNSGVMCIDGERLGDWLGRLSNDNAKGEYYLTDIVALARADGFPCAVVEGDEEELIGVNSRVDLALVETIAQDQLRTRAMERGATLLDPSSVYFSFDTQLGRDVTISPNVQFGPGVTIGDHVEIRGFCHLEGATVDDGAQIGPYARLRPGAHIGKGARVGNFVEIKNADIEAGAKVNHLSYIGDARVGEKANIGAGTITCNYDGFNKSKTDIGKGAFIGSNSALVAPVTIGDGAVIGAGSTITKDVSADALAITRPDHKELSGWAKKNRAVQTSKKKDT